MSNNQLALLAWLFDCGLDAALFLGALYLLCGVALNGVSARDRHFVLMVGVVACLGLPLLSGGALAGVSVKQAIPELGVVGLQTLTLVWATGAALLALQHGLRILRMEAQTRRLVRECEAWRPDFYQQLAARCGITRPPMLILDADSSSASIQGVTRQVIRVGADVASLPVEQQKQIVLHELQHYRRRDLPTTLLARLAVAVYWPIPLAWWLASRVALESERACDDAVLALGYAPRDYAETLISAFERQPVGDQRGLLALAATPSRRDDEAAAAPAGLSLWRPDSTLHKRLISIISPRRQRNSYALYRAVGAGCVVAAALVCGEANLLARALKPSAPTFVRCAVATTSDDAEENVVTGEVMVASRDLDFGYDKQQEMHPLVGIRFCELPVPRGARILSARIIFVGDELPAGSPVLSIFCQQDPAARTFLKLPHDISRRFTGDEVRVEWRPGDDWFENSRTSDSITPELRELVQELVDRPDWREGATMVFGIASAESRPDTYRETASFEHEQGPDVAPVLELEFSAF